MNKQIWLDSIISVHRTANLKIMGENPILAYNEIYELTLTGTDLKSIKYNVFNIQIN